MSVKKLKKEVLSSDGIHKLKGVVYVPETEPKGILQVVHGMTEYIGRYDKSMRFFAEQGYVVFGYDHLGHGNTATDPSELGYIAKKNGWEYLVRDVTVFADAVRLKYGKNLPYILWGHSMGSFIVRLNAWKYGNPDRLIVMGTGGPNPAAGMGLAVIKLIKLFRGDHAISPFIEKLAFGAYNANFKEEGDRLSWLTRDRSIREKYAKDPFCTFHFTASAMQDLITMNKMCNEKKVIGETRKDLPILFVSGALDPVGSDGKGVLQVVELFKEADHPVQHKLYEEARHEILNDFCCDEVLQDMLSFIEQP